MQCKDKVVFVFKYTMKIIIWEVSSVIITPCVQWIGNWVSCRTGLEVTKKRDFSVTGRSGTPWSSSPYSVIILIDLSHCSFIYELKQIC
jgi:hypothetical protein